jgi:S-formylglutathione hydrolase
MSATLKLVSSAKSFGGVVRKYVHRSTSTATDMKFSVYLPPSVAAGGAAPTQPTPVPVLYFLAGLTCTEDTFAWKAGPAAFAAAGAANIALILPDTSPRGLQLPEEKNDANGASWDFGEGAGFYLNATTPKLAPHYNMHRSAQNEQRSDGETNG